MNLQDVLAKQLDYAAQDDRESFLDAELNTRLVRDAERYYRTVYRGSAGPWNLRDEHMFDVLRRLLEHHGPDARAIVWAHNSHLGDAASTDMLARGQFNLMRFRLHRGWAPPVVVGTESKNEARIDPEWPAPPLRPLLAFNTSAPGSLGLVVHPRKSAKNPFSDSSCASATARAPT